MERESQFWWSFGGSGKNFSELDKGPKCKQTILHPWGYSEFRSLICGADIRRNPLLERVAITLSAFLTGRYQLAHYPAICRLDLGNTQADTFRVNVRTLVCSLMLAAASVGAMDTMLQQSVAPTQSPKPLPRLSPSEIEIYKKAQTLIDWTPKQIRHCPALHNLRPAGSQDQLPMVLEGAGQRCALLFHDFLQVSADEEVISESYPRGPNPSPVTLYYPQKLRKFRYIVTPHPIGDLLLFEEYRTDLRGNPCDTSSLGDLFMITSDFTSTWLYLSPTDQHDSHFRYLGIQRIRNLECHVVGFAQDPERVRSASYFYFHGKNNVVLVQGLAWIDSQTSQVLRVITWLLAPRTDIDLRAETSTVDFFPVQPSGTERVLWLPRDVEVEVYFRDIDIRNTHHYSNFKLFRVESTIKPGR